MFRDSVISTVVLQGPSTQGIYQQVIRDFPNLIGNGAMWESRRRLVTLMFNKVNLPNQRQGRRFEMREEENTKRLTT